MKKLVSILFFVGLFFALSGQELDVTKMTKDEVLKLSYDQLLDLPFEQVLQLADVVGVSMDELYQMLLNKNVTSASKTKESLFDSQLSTTVLTRDQIEATGATSIQEALRMAPGIIVREKTNGNYDIHIRGNDNLPSDQSLLNTENSSALVMINGRAIFDFFNGITQWESLPISLEDINRIEIIRGAASALYGPNAVTGVINIITEKITQDSPLISASLQAGMLNSYIGSLGIRKQLNSKLDVGITANYETRDRINNKVRYDLGEDDSAWNSITGDSVGGIGNFTLEELENLKIVNYSGDTVNYWENSLGNTDNMQYGIKSPKQIFPDLKNSKNRLGVNGYLEYSPIKSVFVNLSGGYQQSKVKGTPVLPIIAPMIDKESKTSYINLQAFVKNLSINTNWTGGENNYMRGITGFRFKTHNLQTQAEYTLNVGEKIQIKPGISYQFLSYDDSPFLPKEDSTKSRLGYLNGKQSYHISALSTRLDYRPIKPLRFVAAVRAEKYSSRSKINFTWQLASSYKLNENNLLRLVYSRSNKSIFLMNEYSSYLNNLGTPDYPIYLDQRGNSNYKPQKVDMFEFGYRVRPYQSLLLDLEVYYNINQDFGSVAMQKLIATVKDFEGDLFMTMDNFVSGYGNIPLKTKQIGASLSVDWLISEKLFTSAHFNYQQTRMSNHLLFTNAIDEVNDWIGHFGREVESFSPDYKKGDRIDFVAKIKEKTKSDTIHYSTPSYYGGLSLTYKPIEKLSFTLSSYFYSKQKTTVQAKTVEIKSKVLLNAKVSYQINKNLNIFVNGRNLLNQRQQEFIYMDETPLMIFGGINFKL